MSVEKLIKSIVALLPQNPFVTEQVGAAIDIAKKELTEEQLEKSLRVALEVTNFARETSSDNFFKYNLVIIALLKDVPNVESNKKFSLFETVANLVSNGLNSLKATEAESMRGNFKGELLKLARLAKENQDLFLVEIIALTDYLTEVISNESLSVEDELTVVGYAYVENNLRMSDLTLLNDVKKYYNKFIKVFEKQIF